MAMVLATLPVGLVLPSLPVGRSQLSHIAMKVQEDKAMKEALEQKSAITEEPGRRGRFSRGWGTTLKKDADWLGFIGGRLVDALDDTLYRERYLQAGPSDDGEAVAAVAGERRRVVVLGSGWGSNAVLSQLKNAPDCDVTVISPRNYFLFTPMLAGAALGTLEPRSIIEPIREANPKATYFEARALSIDRDAKSVRCESVECDNVACEIRDFDVPYDDLIVAVGASTNTFGVKGVKEHCLFLKQLSDALKFREQLGYAFEQASLPGLTDEQRVAQLTFVVIGAGPTGVELCGELRDFVAQVHMAYAHAHAHTHAHAHAHAHVTRTCTCT